MNLGYMHRGNVGMSSKVDDQGARTPADGIMHRMASRVLTHPGNRRPGAHRTTLGMLARRYIDNWRALDQAIPPRIRRATDRTTQRRPAVPAPRTAAEEQSPPGTERDDVGPAARARTLLREMDDLSYERFRSYMELQHTLLRPPGAQEPRQGEQPRITTSAPNPTQVSYADPPRELVFTIQDQAAGEAGRSCHWYLQPLRWAGMPDVLGGHSRVTMPGGGDAYDLGTGASARFPASHEGLYIVVCQDAQGRDTVRYLQAVLERRNIEQLEIFTQYLARMDRMAALIQGPRVPVTAVHVNQDEGQASPLRLFLGRSRQDPDKLLLLDMTLGLDPEEHRLVYQGATIEALLANFEHHSEYPKGAIALRIPPNDLDIEPQERQIATDGKGRIGGLSGSFGWLSLALNVGILLVAPFIGGGSLLLSGLVLTSGMASIAAGSLGLVDHLQNADLHELGITLDIITIALGLLSSGVAIHTLIAGQRRAGRAGRILLWSSIAAQSISGLLIMAEGSDRLTRILRNENLSRGDKLKELARATADLIFNGAIRGNPPSALETFQDRLHGFLGDIAGNVSAQNQLTLAFLDDEALRGLHGATAQDLERLAAMLRDDPTLIGRIAGRRDLLRAVRTAGGNTARDLDLALSRTQEPPP